MTLYDKYFKVLAAIMLAGNLLGMASNPYLTLASVIVMGIGVPGILCTFMYMVWATKLTPSFYTFRSIAFLLILYHSIILWLLIALNTELQHDPGETFYPAFFPALIILCSTILIIFSFIKTSNNSPTAHDK